MRGRPQRIDPTRPSADMLVAAYAQGVFPMAHPHSGMVEWFSPDPRGVIPLESFHTSRNLLRAVRQGRFAIRSNTDFRSVMQSCAQNRRDDDETWISDGLMDAYHQLHELGLAHSVEAWMDDQLVGGLYGVHLGAVFFGESMFSRPEAGGTNASKICLVHLVRWMKHQGFGLLDTQFNNEHLTQFGCVEIPRSTYLTQLRAALGIRASWGSFRPLGQHEV